ncbi:MAG: hypothetical protein JF606_16775 [Burkholderiales bacterium]|nr:hypothetical protein [Burkholderiales bacterium]
MNIKPPPNQPYSTPYHGSAEITEITPERASSTSCPPSGLLPRTARDMGSARRQPSSPAGVFSQLKEAPTRFVPRQPLPGATLRDDALEEAHLDESAALIGETIAPEIAERFMDKKIRFDGIGRIESIESSLSEAELQTLNSSRIPSLTQTRSPAPREAPLPERECLMHLLHATRNAKDPNAAALHQDARRFWLEDIVNTDRATAFFRNSEKALGHLPELRDLATQLVRETEVPKTRPQYLDAIYGRKFESVIARELVDDPPEGVLRLSERLNLEVMTYVGDLPDQLRDEVLDDVAGDLFEDPRPWQAVKLKPAIDAFIVRPSIQSLEALLGSGARDGLDVINSVYLAHHVWINGARRAAEAPWFARSQPHYDRVVKRSNGDGTSPIEVNTNGYGARLIHHPGQTTFSGFEEGRHWTYDVRPDLKKPTQFEDNLLSNGHVISCGASGMTNVLVHVAIDLESRDPTVSRGDAVIAMVMLVCMDGGHSIHEVLATNASIPSGLDEVDHNLAFERLATFNAPYRALADLPASPQDKEKIAFVLDRALDETLDYFDSLSAQKTR